MSPKLVQRAICVTAATFAGGFAAYYGPQSHSQSQIKSTKMLSPYEATFSVPITCESCTSDISRALSRLEGVQETSFSISSKLVTTKGTEPPSNIIAAIQSTGREAILRGSGNPNTAAVCILETPPPDEVPKLAQPTPVRGLARLIELGERLTMLDLTLTGMEKGSYRASVRISGDISAGKKSMGGIFEGQEGKRDGHIGELEVDETGRGMLVGEIGWQVWEMVGRGVLVEKVEDAKKDANEAGGGAVVGVIARSAGLWENEKTVCSCTGKTLWEEREQMVRRGML